MKLAHALIWLVRILAVAVFASAVVSAAEQVSFISSLSPENKTATGLTRLTEQQSAALESQIQKEIAVARQGNTVAFSTSFTHRRTPMQRSEAGLDLLMTPELARLDALVAAELANRPSPSGPLIVAPAAAGGNWVEVTPKKWEVHGEVSLTYVTASGGAHGYGASMVTTATDPSGKFAVTFGLSQFNGKGFRYGRYPYSSYYPYSLDGYDCDRGW